MYNRIGEKSKMKLTFDEVASIMEDLREIVFKCCMPHSHWEKKKKKKTWKDIVLMENYESYVEDLSTHTRPRTQKLYAFFCQINRECCVNL